MTPFQRTFSCIILVLVPCGIAAAQSAPIKYLRYEHDGAIGYGILEGDNVRELRENFLDSQETTGKTLPLSDLRILAPVEPRKVIAVGLNYESHLGIATPAAVPPLFAKLPTCIVGPGDDVVLPGDAKMVHYEAEMALIVGRKAKNVSEDEALDYVFGATCGNDVSGRAWQGSDLQWFRAKATDTFGPIGPVVVTGLNYDDLLLEGRLNGETVQSQRTADLIYGTAAIVSFISKYVTLMPGDVIFTGTPGRTGPLRPGDVFEVELEGVGVLSNPIAAE